MRGEGGVAGEGRVVGVQFHSWVKCTMADEAFASVGVFSIVGAIYASVIGGYYWCKLQQKTCSHGLLIGLGGLNSNISYLVLMVSIKGKISLCFDYSKFITGVHPFLNCNSCYTRL